MIKRTYFMSIVVPHFDGKGSHSFIRGTCDIRSWFADPKKVMEEFQDHLASKIIGINVTKIQVIAFNRI